MFSNSTIDNWPADWNKLLEQLKPGENSNPKFWQTLVATHLSTTFKPSSSANSETQYKTFFQEYWEKDRPNIQYTNEDFIEAAKSNYDVFIKNWLSKLPEESREEMINTSESNQDKALHIAIQNKNMPLIKILIANGANVNATGYFNHSPLHSAVQVDSPEIISLLLESGASLDAKRKDSLKPIHLAATEGCVQAIKVLVKFDKEQLKNISKEGRTAFYTAATMDQFDVMKALLAADDDINQFNTYTRRTVLHDAVLDNNIPLLDFLIENKVDVNKPDGSNFSPLQRAAMQKKPCLEIAIKLLQAGADPNYGNPPPFYLLAQNSDENSSQAKQFAELLVKNGAQQDIKTYGATEFDNLFAATNASLNLSR